MERFSVGQVMLPACYSTFEIDVAACGGAGYGGIGVWTPKLGEGRAKTSTMVFRQR